MRNGFLCSWIRFPDPEKRSLRVGQSGISVLARTLYFHPLQAVQLDSGNHAASYALGTGVNWQGCEAGHSPPSTGKVKTRWSYTSTPPTRFHGMDSENFIGVYSRGSFERENETWRSIKDDNFLKI